MIELLLKTGLEERAEFFEGTIGGPIINKDSARMSNSVRMMLNTYLRPLALLPNDGPPFSIGDWMRDDGQNGFLFFTSRAAMHATLRPLISAWMDITILSEREAAFRENDIRGEALNVGVKGLNILGVDHEIKELKKDGLILDGKGQNTDMVTTRQALTNPIIA